MWGSFVMQIQLGLVGLDLVLLVMGQELVSFKIVDAALKTEIASETACDGPCGSSAVIVALTVQDMSLRDMQVPVLFLILAFLLQAAVLVTRKKGMRRARCGVHKVGTGSSVSGRTDRPAFLGSCLLTTGTAKLALIYTPTHITCPSFSQQGRLNPMVTIPKRSQNAVWSRQRVP